MSARRDVVPDKTSTSAASPIGRNVIVVIGIDQYRHWGTLTNAVSDASGASALFRRLGFQEPVAPLLDAAATGAALRALVADDLKTLSAEDSLVLFYAGHGGSEAHARGDRTIKTGYLIPADAEADKVSTWVDLEGWLRSISLLPPRHILVILDACHSGIALDPVIKWRDVEATPPAPLAALQARCSRRVITSALDDERALDDGPVPGHSLFTGCLIRALTGELAGTDGFTTGSQLAVWVQQRVQSYPNARQTPDFGTFALDDRGEIAIPLLRECSAAPRFDEPDQAEADREASAGTKPVALPPATTARPAARAPWRRLRREGEWLLIAAPLLAVGIASMFWKSC